MSHASHETGCGISTQPPLPRTAPIWRNPLALIALAVACAAPNASSRRPTVPEAPPIAWTDPERLTKVAAAANELEPLVAEYVATSKVPGMAVGIVAGGKLVWFKAFGVRDLASGAPVDEDTVFRIASMTKAFVSAAVLRLRDEGKLSLDDPAERYLPELRGLAYPTADSSKITVRQLLSHAGGLPEDNATADLRLPMSEADFDRSLAAGLSLSTAPGSEYEYSNLGFALAGRIVTRVSGMRVQDYVTRHLLTPLGMRATRWDADAVSEDHMAHGYGRSGSAMPSAGLDKYADDSAHEEPVLADGAFAAPGGLWTSSRDYARWVAFQLAAWPPRDDTDDGPVRRASIREAQEVHRPMPFTAERDEGGALEVATWGYGFGWFGESTCRFARIVRHSGGLPGYGSFALLLPEHDVGVFTMTNLTYTSGFRVAFALADGLHARGVLPTRPRALSPQLVRARAAVLDLLDSWSADRATSLFDVNYWAYERLEKLEARLAAVRKMHGTCQSDSDSEPANVLRGRMRLACTRGAVEMSVELTSDVPPGIQSLVLDPVLVPSDALSRAATDAAALLARWDDAAAAELLAPGTDRAAVRKVFARITRNQGACSLGQPIKSDGATSATFRLSCDRGAAILAVKLAPTSGQLLSVAASSVPSSLRCPL